MRSLNEIIAELETFANAHYQIHTFGHGDVWEVSPSSDSVTYPLLWLVPQGGSTGLNEITVRFTVLCMDLVDSGEKNETEVLSDTHQIILDVCSYYRQQHDQNYIIEFGSTITPFTESMPERVSGHSIEITIRQPFAYNECAIPMANVPAPITPTCASATVQNASTSPTYQVSVASGGVLTLPQLKVLDSDGVTEITANYIPSASGYVAECSPSTCVDATVQLNGTTIGTIPSGDTESFDVLQNGSPVGSWNGSAWIIPPCAGGSVVEIGIYSDSGFTNPITSAENGDTIYIRAENVSGITPVEYLFYYEDVNGVLHEIYKGVNSNTSVVLSYVAGVGSVYCLATEDASEPKNWVGQSVEFEVISNFWLDIYPDAILAVGTTKLRSTFTTDTINVRRSSDNASDDFTPVTGTIPYIDGSSQGTSTDLSTFVGASNGLVTALYDQSTYGNDAINTTAASQPTLISSGSFVPIRAVQNGIFCDGNNDYLAIALNSIPSVEWVGFGQFVTVNAVVNFIDVTTLRALFVARAGAIIPLLLMIESGKVRCAINGSSLEIFLSTATITTGTTYTIGVTINGQTLKIYINGLLDSTHTIVSSVASRALPAATNSLISLSGNGAAVPTAQFLNAYLGTVVIEKGVYSDAEMLDVHNRFGS